MYSRLITLGCSITHHIGWADRLSSLLNLPLVNLAKSSGSNYLQQKRFQELVFADCIKKSDIIIWQITGTERCYLRTKPTNNYINHKNKSDKNNVSVIQESKNIFDNQERIDFLSHSEISQQYRVKLDLDFDIEQHFEDLLFYIISAKFMTPNVFVVYGWNTVAPQKYKSVFENQLAKNKIKILSEPIVDWCHKNKLGFHPDNVHPLTESHARYAEKYLHLELKKELEIE